MMRQKWLVAALLALAGLGVFAIYSSSSADFGWSLALRQVIWCVLGIAAASVMMRVRLKTLSAFAPLLYAAAIVMLIVVLAIGRGPHGTRRWFDLGLFRFQPSEVAKIAVILMLSRYLSDKGLIGDSLKVVLGVFAIVAIPAALILYEPDLGTAVVMGFLAFPLLYAAGLHTLLLLLLLSPLIALICAWEVVAWVVFVALLVTIAVFGRFKTSLIALVFGVNFLVYSLAPRLWNGLAPYQQARVLAFLNPDNYRFGAGFQIIQSKIAIGSGGFTGKGLLQGTQKALGLVPAQHTDFIFSLMGEELGFVGGAAVLLLLLFVVYRIYRIAGTVRSRFAMYFCFGFASLILIQTFINVGMTLGITPVTGLPLPFVSYGGSQMIVFWCGMGIVLGSSASRKEY
jgi:rod shape determining protein RodA